MQSSRFMDSRDHTYLADVNNIYEDFSVFDEEYGTDIPQAPSTQTLLPVSQLPVKYQKTVFAQYSFLNAVQSACFTDAFQSDQDLVISAPTGSGKTGIMELCICRTLETSKDRPRILYLAPTRALCAERLKDWKGKFEGRLGLKCQLFTGDGGDEQMQNSSQNSQTMKRLFDTDLIISTPEKWDSITRRMHGGYRSSQREKINLHIDLIVIDEVHILNESRGATLEVVLSRMRHFLREDHRRQRRTRFVAISATVPNIEDIAEWLGGKNTRASSSSHIQQSKYPNTGAKFRVFGDEYRPVSLERIVLAFPSSCDGEQIDSNEGFSFDRSLNDKLLNIIHEHSHGKPSLIFCSTRNSTEVAAKALAEKQKHESSVTHAHNPLNVSNMQIIRLTEAAKKLNNEKLKQLLPLGIAFHHAGLTSNDRLLIEKLYIDGFLRVICTTSTLACGVNLPAHLVIVKSTMMYEDGRWVEYSDLDILQMMGRAGRPQFDKSGTVVIMTSTRTAPKYENLIHGETNIESALHLNLVEHLNAEIVLGAVTSLQESIQWLSSTFLAIRLLKNPGHYQIVHETGSLSTHDQLKFLSEKSLTELRNTGAIKADISFQRITPTELGENMARFYLKLGTIAQVSSIESKADIGCILKLVASASEFSQTRLMTGDRDVLNRFNKPQLIKYPIQGRVTTIEDKIQVLIQSALNKLPFNEFNSAIMLEGESRRVVATAIRIVKCIIQKAKLDQDGTLLRNALTLCKNMMSKTWDWLPENKPEIILRQLDKIGQALATVLAKSGLDSIDKIRNADPRRIETLCKKNAPFGNQVVDNARKIPQLSMNLTQRRTKSIQSDQTFEEICLQTSIEVLNIDSCYKYTKDSAPVYVNFVAYFSDGKLIDFRRTALKSASKTFSLKIAIPNPQVSIICCLICDNFAGIDIVKDLQPDISEKFRSTSTNRQCSESNILQFPSFSDYAYEHDRQGSEQTPVLNFPSFSEYAYEHSTNAPSQKQNPLRKTAEINGTGKIQAATMKRFDDNDVFDLPETPKSLPSHQKHQIPTSSVKKRQTAIQQYLSNRENKHEGSCLHKCADKLNCAHMCCKVGKKLKRSGSSKEQSKQQRPKKQGPIKVTQDVQDELLFSSHHMDPSFFDVLPMEIDTPTKLPRDQKICEPSMPVLIDDPPQKPKSLIDQPTKTKDTMSTADDSIKKEPDNNTTVQEVGNLWWSMLSDLS